MPKAKVLLCRRAENCFTHLAGKRKRQCLPRRGPCVRSYNRADGPNQRLIQAEVLGCITHERFYTVALSGVADHDRPSFIHTAGLLNLLKNSDIGAGKTACFIRKADLAVLHTYDRLNAEKSACNRGGCRQAGRPCADISRCLQSRKYEDARAR